MDVFINEPNVYTTVVNTPASVVLGTSSFDLASYVQRIETGQYASDFELFLTGSILETRINSITGFSNSTGTYYPLDSNPSGYVTGLVVRPSDTGVLVLRAETGQFASDFDVFSTGFILDQQIRNATGLFYPNTNPSGYITGSVVRPNETGTFITQSQTGQFASTVLLALTGANLQSQLTSLTGIYYPLIGNPSGFVTGQVVRPSETGNFLTIQQTGQFASDADINILTNWTGATTGIYYPLFANPSNYITSNQTGQFSTFSQLTGASGVLSERLISSGSYLFGLVNASSAGVSSLNSLSGALTLVGVGNVSVNGVGQTITISGNTGAYSSFVTLGITGQFASAVNLVATGTTLSNWTGSSTQIFYPLRSNPSGYVQSSDTGNFITSSQTGNFSRVVVTGSNTLNYVNLTGLSGVFVSTGGAGLVIIDGGNLQNQITSIINWSGTTPSLYYPLNSNPNNYTTISYVTGISGVLSDRLISTGSYLYSLINAFSAGVSSLNGKSGILNLIGTGNISITTGSQSIIISGNTGVYANFLARSETGEFASDADILGLQSQINTITSWTGSADSIYVNHSETGQFASSANLLTIQNWTGSSTGLYYPYSVNPANYVTSAHGHNYVTGISVTGNTPITGLINLTSVGGLVIYQSGNTIQFSGGAGGGGEANTASNLGIGSGLFSQKSSVDLQFKSLIGGSGINISGNTNQLVLSVTGINGGGSTDVSNLTGCRNAQFGIILDAGSSIITTGFKGYTRIPRNMTANSWEIVGDVSGYMVIDIWKTGFANYPPSSLNTVAGTQKPFLTNQLTNYTGNLSTWITNFTQGDYVAFNVESVSGLSRAVVTIYGASI
jgi:hypothetical protein